MSKLTRLTREIALRNSPTFADERLIVSDAIDNIKVSIPAGAVNKRVNLQPSGEVYYMAILSSSYPEGLTFKINDPLSPEIPLTSMTLLTSEASLNGVPQTLYVSNGSTPVDLRILVGRSRIGIPVPTTTPSPTIPIRYDIVSWSGYSEGEISEIKNHIADYIDNLSAGDDIPFIGISCFPFQCGIVSRGSDIFAPAYLPGYVLLSSDGGVSWELRNSGLPSPPGSYVICIALNDNDIYVGHYGLLGVYKSTDNGLNWVPVNNGMPLSTIWCLAVTNTVVFAGANDGIYRSVDNGANWTKVMSTTGAYIADIYINGSTVYACTTNGSYSVSHVFFSTNNGDSWTEISTGLPAKRPNRIIAKGSDLYCGLMYFGNLGAIYKSTNNGASWLPVLTCENVWSLVVSGDRIFAATTGGGVYVSSDEGASWTNSYPIPPVGYPFNGSVYSLHVKGTDLYAGPEVGIFKSSDNGATWVNPNNCIVSYVGRYFPNFPDLYDLAAYKNNVLTTEPIPMSPGEKGSLDKDGTTITQEYEG